MFFSRKKPARSYDPATQQPALRCSICTGEQVAGLSPRMAILRTSAHPHASGTGRLPGTVRHPAGTP